MTAPPLSADREPGLAALAGRGTAWLREAAWPLWLEHGIDWKRRGFHEHLDPATLRCAAPFRRLRVAARQTYVFAEAALRGVPRADAALDLGLAFLRGPARGGDGGYAWVFGLDHATTDPARDLYDHAFVLLAFSHAAAVVGGDALRAEAHALVRYLDARFAHVLGGYHEALPRVLPRRQNPHMHLLEAMLAGFEAFGDALFLDRADALARLFVDRLFQPEGALAEFFDEDWRPLREGGRFLAEPGHHAEWIWLLRSYGEAVQRAGRPPASGQLDAAEGALRAFNDRFGTAGGACLVDGVWSDGTPASFDARLWPQLERLKADIRRPAPEAARATAPSLQNVFAFFEGVPPGLWHERRSAEGGFVRGPAPASSLYHLTSAFLDLDRCVGRLSGALA